MRKVGAFIGSILFAAGLLVSFGLRQGFFSSTGSGASGDTAGTLPAEPSRLTPLSRPQQVNVPPQPVPATANAPPQPDVNAPDTARFRALYQLGRQGGQPRLSRAIQVIRNARILELVTEGLSEALVLQRGVDIHVRPCNEENAFYEPGTSRIVLCEELFLLAERLFADGRSQAEFEEAVLGATLFFVMHEVGHALVHQFGVSTWGGDEDAADAIATYLLARVGLHGVAFSGAQSFAYMAMNRQANASLKFWDEHSLDEQRFFNISCWLYGSAPGPYAFLVASGQLPLSRAERCPEEFARLERDASRDLGPHLRPQAVSGNAVP